MLDPFANIRLKVVELPETSPCGIPLILFHQDYIPPCHRTPPIDVHKALHQAMRKDWIQEKVTPSVISFVDNSTVMIETMEKYHLSKDQCAAIVYYTYDVSLLGVAVEDNVYKVLNHILSRREVSGLNCWRDFLYYFVSGLEKLPDCKETLFRNLPIPALQLSDQYKVGKTVVWVGLSTTTSNRKAVSDVIGEDGTQGTYILMEATQAKDISCFSFCPHEKEFVLLPNAVFLVKEVLTDSMKKLMDIPESIDGLILQQQLTPSHLMVKSTWSSDIGISIMDQQINSVSYVLSNPVDIEKGSNLEIETNTKLSSIENACKPLKHLLPDIMKYAKTTKDEMDNKLKEKYRELSLDQLTSVCLITQLDNDLFFKLNVALKSRNLKCFEEYLKLFCTAISTIGQDFATVYCEVDGNIQHIYEKTKQIIIWGLQTCSTLFNETPQKTIFKIKGLIIDLSHFSKKSQFKILLPGQIYNIQLTNSNLIELQHTSSNHFNWIDWKLTNTTIPIPKGIKLKLVGTAQQILSNNPSCKPKLLNLTGTCEQKKDHLCKLKEIKGVPEIKVVLLGGGGIGAKSTLIIKFIQNRFLDEYDPTIEDSYRKQLTVDGITFLGDFTDTAGQEEYKGFWDEWIKYGSGFLLGYSINSRTSYEEAIHTFHNEIVQRKDLPWVPIVLVGNKCDLEKREVSREEAELWAKERGYPFFETSAMTGYNVHLVIYTLVRLTHLHLLTGQKVMYQKFGF